MGVRLDQLLHERGLFPSRERARRAVMAGTVEVEDRRIDKPGTRVAEDVRVRVLAPSEPFASRAGRKLAAALDRFDLVPEGWTCLDVGASTGGFTDCLL
ncbi:MAG: S4 domain-containing protein, partial [Acidobacteriota bacterium]